MTGYSIDRYSAPRRTRLTVFMGAGLTALVAFGSPASAQFARGDWPGLFADRAEAYPQRPIRQRQAKPSYPKLPDAPKNDLKPQGPLVIMVSLDKQRLKIYDERGLFAESPISSGTKSHPTPMGVFSILEKSKWHRSNLYSSAPMPFMQRLTWSGVALHAGELPGYPASHGCIRLPAQFAARLWNWTARRGARVIITPDEVTPADVTHKTLVARLPSPVAALPETKLPVRTADASGALPVVKSDAIEMPLRGTTTDIKIADKASDAAADSKSMTTTEPKADDKAAPVADIAEKPADAKTADANDVKPAEAASDASAEPKVTETSVETKAVEAKAAEPKADTPAPEAKAAEPQVAEPKAAETKPADASPSRTGAVSLTINDAMKGTSDKPAIADAPTEPQTPAWMQLPKRTGQVAVLISKKDGKLYMRQNFEPVFEVPVTFTDDAPLGTHVFTVRKASEDNSSFEWSVASMPGVVKTVVSRQPGKTPSGKMKMRDVFSTTFGPTPMTASQALDRITIPEEALQRIAFNLSAGSSIVVSDVSFNTGGETGRGTEFIVPLR